MTTSSNPITDILVKAITDFVIMESKGTADTENVKARIETAAQALYEAVATKVLACGRMDIPEVGNVIELDEVLTNLSLLFGVDLGASEKPKSGNKPSGKQVDTRSETAFSPVGHGGYCPKHGGWSSQVPMMCPGCQEQGNDLLTSSPDTSKELPTDAPSNPAGISKEGDT